MRAENATCHKLCTNCLLPSHHKNNFSVSFTAFFHVVVVQFPVCQCVIQRSKQQCTTCDLGVQLECDLVHDGGVVAMASKQTKSEDLCWTV